MLYSLLPEQEVTCDESKPFYKEFYESCFKITLTVTKLTAGPDTHKITLVTCPEEEHSYELLTSVLITVNGDKNWVDFDLWKTEQTVFDLAVNAEKLKVGFSLDIHDVLAPRDLHSSGNFRNLRILSSKEEYFVNATALNDLGGSLFREWLNRERTNETTIAATELDNDELDTLLKACCAYSTVIVTRQNFDILLRVAWKYKIVGVLRAIESYLLNAKSIHVIDKLDLSYKYKLALLASGVLKTMGSQFQRKELLVDYLRKKNLPFCPQHLLDILEMVLASLSLVGITLFILLLAWRSLRTRGIGVQKRSKDAQNNALIVLGSGGHTMEMFKLMNGVCQRFNRRIYVATDELSKQKAASFESGYGNEKPEVIFTTRSREVGKSIVSSVPKILSACLEAFQIVLTSRPNLILCNGPGTCVPICIAAFFFDLFRLIDCRIVYVESVCRVKSLSLSGKILYHARLYDGFLVQWPELKQKYGQTEYLGRFS